MDPTKYTPSFLAADESQSIVRLVVALGIAQTVFIVLFVISRFINHTFRSWDVYLMIPAYFFGIGNIMIAALLTAYGGAGRHAITLDYDTLKMWPKFEFAEQFVYDFAIMFPKLSILCLYLRIFSTRNYRYAIFAVMAVVVLTCVSGLIMNLFICRPVAYFWDKTIVNGKCYDIVSFYRYISVPNIVTDVWILLLPIYGVWQLQMSRASKIGISLTFVAGGVGIVTGIMRMVMFFRLHHLTLNSDFTWESVHTLIWTDIEPAVYMIAGTLPSLRPLIRCICENAKNRHAYLRTKISNYRSTHSRLDPSTRDNHNHNSNSSSSFPPSSHGHVTMVREYADKQEDLEYGQYAVLTAYPPRRPHTASTTNTNTTAYTNGSRGSARPLSHHPPPYSRVSAPPPPPPPVSTPHTSLISPITAADEQNLTHTSGSEMAKEMTVVTTSDHPPSSSSSSGSSSAAGGVFTGGAATQHGGRNVARAGRGTATRTTTTTERGRIEWG